MKGKQNEKVCRECFFEHHKLTTRELQQDLVRRGVRLSLVALYAILKDLLAENFLIKRSDTYMLNLSWLLATSQRLRDLVEEITTGPHGSHAFQIEEIEQLGVRRSWRVSSLIEVNDLWVQLLILLLRRSTSQTLHELVPHLWYAYLPSHKDDYFQRTFKALRAEILVCVQGRTALDSEPIRERSARYQRLQLPRHSKIKIPGEGTRYFASVDNWFTTVKIPLFLATQISNLFRSSRSDDPSFRNKLNRILRTKASCTLSIAVAPRRAQWLKEIVEMAEPSDM